MEAVENVYARCEEIVGFIACHDALKCDKSHIVCQISDLAGQIQAIVAPLRKRDEINDQVEKRLRQLPSVLDVTLRNLQSWNDSHSHSHRLHLHLHLLGQPGQLKDNKEFLLVHHAALTRAVQIVMKPKGYNIISPPSNIRPLLEQRSVQKTKANEDIEFFQAEDFWKVSVGDESDYANTEDFCDLLASWLDEDLGPVARKRLILRLDQYHTGYISFFTFRTFVRNGRLRETIHLYSLDPSLPLLLWVDSDVTDIAEQMLGAVGHDVFIVQFASTHALKSWVSLHLEFLKYHNSSSELRIISNQILHERDLNTHLRYYNRQAGEQVTSYIREEAGLSCPILIITTAGNIESTAYVKRHHNVGSTGAKYYVYKTFVAGLTPGSGGKDDTRWMKYDA
ncbi:hypothetical protein CPC08DRAFT_759814 [Agrocybe pediades]|nr:hypothetical protein CPC08DRAFT_759814 [Agrocybe pediades]